VKYKKKQTPASFPHTDPTRPARTPQDLRHAIMAAAPVEEIEKHVAKKYEVNAKLGKGVRPAGPAARVRRAA
jgi:hypothetical protein